MATGRISVAEAGSSAARTLQEFLVPDSARAMGLADEVGPAVQRAWSIRNLPAPKAEAEVGPATPLFDGRTDIYDIRGRLLFRDFTSSLRDGQRLRVRTAAYDTLKTPVWSLGIGKPFDVDSATGKALEVASELHLKPVKGSKWLVCYSYPKLGLLCKRRDGSKAVIDLGHLEPVDGQTQRAAEAEFPALWSPFDLVSKVSAAYFKELWSLNTAAMPRALDAEAGPDALASAVEGARASESRAVLPPMKLYGQQTQYYCAVATAQMILEYHGIKKSQNQIAAAMNTGPNGTSNQNQVKGYDKLAKGRFEATFDDSASFMEAKMEISRGHPLKSGVPGHARACAGWKTRRGSPGIEKRWLYVYDPWPPQQGDTYWEDWSAIEHTNFIYLRHLIESRD